MLQHALSDKAPKIAPLTGYDVKALLLLNTYFFGDDLGDVQRALRTVMGASPDFKVFDIIFYIASDQLVLIHGEDQLALRQRTNLINPRQLVEIEPHIRSAILKFVDEVVPGGDNSVWLTGSRVRGNARPDSDWDVLVITSYGPRRFEDLFDRGTQLSEERLEGGYIELITAHPDLWDDPRRYMVECRESGIQLR